MSEDIQVIVVDDNGGNNYCPVLSVAHISGI